MSSTINRTIGKFRFLVAMSLLFGLGLGIGFLVSNQGSTAAQKKPAHKWLVAHRHDDLALVTHA